MTRPQILFLTGESPWGQNGGYFRVTRDAVEVLAAQADVHLVCVRGEAAQLPAAQAAKLAGVHFLAGSSQGKRAGQAASLLRGRAMVTADFAVPGLHRRLRAIVQQARPGIVVVNHLKVAAALPALAAAPGAAVVYLSHNSEADAARSVAEVEPRPWLRAALLWDARAVARAERDLARRSRAVVALTEEDAARLQALAGGPRPVVIPPAFPLPAPMAGVAGPIGRMLLVGSFMWRVKRENVQWLAEEVLPLVRARRPDARLEIVGHQADRLAPVAARHPGVHIVSSPPEIDPFYREPAVIVVPERQVGGVKLKTIEAATYGAPIVTTPAGAEGTGLRNEHSCLVADEPRAMAEALVRCLDDAALRRTLGAEARAVAAQRFSMASFAAAWTGLVARLAGDSSGA